MEKYKIYVLVFFMTIIDISKSISCESNFDTCCCFSFTGILKSLFQIEHSQDLHNYNYEVVYDMSSKSNTRNKNYILYFNNLSEDEMLSISTYLNPLELNKLSTTCSSLFNRINYSIWSKYNIIHKYKTWDISLSPVQVSYGCFYYSVKKFQMAANLGHPGALHEINKRRNKAITINSHDTNINDDFSLIQEYLEYQEYLNISKEDCITMKYKFFDLMY